jgi:hypothetical protein
MLLPELGNGELFVVPEAGEFGLIVLLLVLDPEALLLEPALLLQPSLLFEFLRFPLGFLTVLALLLLLFGELCLALLLELLF